jgi:hypothetical protein
MKHMQNINIKFLNSKTGFVKRIQEYSTLTAVTPAVKLPLFYKIEEFSLVQWIIIALNMFLF